MIPPGADLGGSCFPLSIWTDGAAKGNHIAGADKIAGVGVVFGHRSLPPLFGPVKHNLTEAATNNAAELQAAIIGLEEAKAKNIKVVAMHTDSELLVNIMTKWIDQWKANNWKKSDGTPPKKLYLVKRLYDLKSEMKIIWTWVPRNSCPEMVLADILAKQGCKCAIKFMLKESEMNKLFRRTIDARKKMYPYELPPTLLRTRKEVKIPPGLQVMVSCTLDIPDRLKQQLINSKDDIFNMTSDQAYGLVTTLRTSDPIEEDGTVVARCHSFHSAFEMVENGKKKKIEPTLILPIGSVVGLAFSRCYGYDDDEVDKNLTKGVFFTSRNWEEGLQFNN